MCVHTHAAGSIVYHLDSGICTSSACGIADALDYTSFNNPGTSRGPHMLETLDSEHPNKWNHSSRNEKSIYFKGGANKSMWRYLNSFMLVLQAADSQSCWVANRQYDWCCTGSALQTMSKGLTSYDIQHGEFVQILNGHWFAVSTVNSLNKSPSFCKVKVHAYQHSRPH